MFQTYLVWDAILKENSWELWATILLGLAMVATRVVAGIIRKDVTDSHAVALRNVGWAVLVTQSLTMVRSLCLRQASVNHSFSLSYLWQRYAVQLFGRQHAPCGYDTATVYFLLPLDVRNLFLSVQHAVPHAIPLDSLCPCLMPCLTNVDRCWRT